MDHGFCDDFHGTAECYRFLLLSHLQGGAIAGAKDSSDKRGKRDGEKGNNEPQKGTKSSHNHRHYHSPFHNILVPYHDFIFGANANRRRLFEN